MDFLDPVAIQLLTGKTQHTAQARVLRFMGIEFRRRPDGSLAVLRSHAEAILSGEIRKKPKILTMGPVQ
jgi:hypothetical protein